MAVLLLRLAAPLQAWGSNAKFNTRTTEREPTKSGVIGMLAAALGIQRNSDSSLLEPLVKLRFGVRADREGKLLKDFHMVHFTKSSDVTDRHYLTDAVFLVALESEDSAYLEHLAEALKNPVYPLYLGRRSCPPTLPVVLGIRDEEMKAVLQNEPCLFGEWKRRSFRIVYEVPEDGAPVQDLPISFSQLHRQHGWRMKREEMIAVQETASFQEHDPFAEL